MTGSTLYCDEDVTYEYPPTAEQCRKELFARARHIEKMRQREKAAILRLDGEAELNHRERKVQLACDRRGHEDAYACSVQLYGFM
jgi:hypothetical protein